MTAVWFPSGQLAGVDWEVDVVGGDIIVISVRLRATILGAKRKYSSSIDWCRFAPCNRLVGVTRDVSEVYSRWRSRCRWALGVHIGFP